MQTPPPGEFAYGNLTWRDKETFYKKHSINAKRAIIPAERVEDFVKGEEKRGHTMFYMIHQYKRDEPADRQPVNNRFWVQKVEFHCSFGPQDDRCAPKVEKTGQRTSKKARGLGQRRGCRCAFTVTRYWR